MNTNTTNNTNNELGNRQIDKKVNKNKTITTTPPPTKTSKIIMITVLAKVDNNLKKIS